MTRLERAKAELAAALREEIGSLTSRLQTLESRVPTQDYVRRERPAPARKLGRPPKPASGPCLQPELAGPHNPSGSCHTKPGRPKTAKPAPEKKKPRRPRQFLGNLAPSTEPEGEHSCPSCGREGLRKRPGPGGVLAYHVAPEPCGLPCAGGRIDHLTPEDKPDGVHSSKACAKRCGLKGRATS